MKTKVTTCAMAAAVAMIGAVPLLVQAVPAKGENLKMAQVDVQIGRDRDRDDRYRYGRERDRDVTVGIGERGVEIGPRQRCRSVTTTVRRSDGRQITRRERRCD
jgi:hypothetical protein